MKTIIGIDPGPKESGWVIWNGSFSSQYGKSENNWLVREIEREAILGAKSSFPTQISELIIEKVMSYGMPVSESIFETVYWTGRFAQAWGDDPVRVPRLDVKMHLCHDSRAKDSNIRQALIDRFEPDLPPRCRPRSVLKGITKDCWAALALAVYWYDTNGLP